MKLSTVLTTDQAIRILNDHGIEGQIDSDNEWDFTYLALGPVIDVLTPHNSDCDWVHELHPAFGLAETLKYCPSLPDFQGRLITICKRLGREDLAAIAFDASEAALHNYMIDLKATLPN